MDFPRTSVESIIKDTYDFLPKYMSSKTEQRIGIVSKIIKLDKLCLLFFGKNLLLMYTSVFLNLLRWRLMNGALYWRTWCKAANRSPGLVSNPKSLLCQLGDLEKVLSTFLAFYPPPFRMLGQD